MISSHIVGIYHGYETKTEHSFKDCLHQKEQNYANYC